MMKEKLARHKIEDKGHEISRQEYSLVNFIRPSNDGSSRGGKFKDIIRTLKCRI